MKSSEFKELFDRVTEKWPKEDIEIIQASIREAWPDPELRAVWINTIKQLEIIQ